MHQPNNVDILTYFEIGKVFYKTKTFFYPVTPYFPENLFSSHAMHPPSFSLLQSLSYLIQGSSDYYRVNAFIYAFYVGMFFWVMLTIMRVHYFWGFLLLILSFISSHYAIKSILLTKSLDTFRLTYFMFAFFTLQKLLSAKNSQYLVTLFTISLGLALGTHSTGLLFYLLMIPIFLSVYVTESLSQKYKTFVKIFISAFLIGGWQYLINLYQYGKLISDDFLTRSVYGYWEFMRYERDLYSISLMFWKFVEQFKFSIHGYGLFYPLFLVLCLLCIKELFSVIKQAFLNIFTTHQKKLPVFAATFLFVLGFWTVLLLSILANQEVIIKNFRYMLTPYPCMVIMIFFLIKYTLKFLLERKEKILDFINLRLGLIKKISLITTLPLIFSIIFLYSYKLSSKKLLKPLGVQDFRLHVKEFLNIDKNKSLNGLLPGNKEIISYLDKNLNDNDILFAFDRGQIYTHLLNKKIAFFMSDEVLPLFSCKNKQKLYENLKKRHIKYIYSSYYKPSIYHQTCFSKLLVDPKYTTLIMNEGLFSLFQLNEKPNHVNYSKKLVQKIKVSINKKNSYSLNVALEPNQEYLVMINNMSRDITSSTAKPFYALHAVRNIEESHHSLALFTYNDATQFWFSTRSRSDSLINKASVNISITAKNEPVNLNVIFYKLDKSDFQSA